MKKFLFVAVLAAGSLVACNDTSNTVNGVDTTTQAYKDSVAKSGNMMNNGTTTPMSDTTGKGSMMSSDTMGKGSMMSSDTMGKGSMMSDTSHK